MNNLREAMGSKEKQGGVLPVSIGKVSTKTTSKGSPYLDVEVGDCSGSASLKFWQDTQAYRVLTGGNMTGGFFRLGGEFFRGDYGLECVNAHLTEMTSLEKEEFLGGGEEGAKHNQALCGEIIETVERFSVASYRELLKTILEKPEIKRKFMRAAAARRNHHARRGGLLAHTASMLRVAKAVAGCYPELSEDLLCSGVICHDLGKIVENDTGEGFTAEYSMAGEMLGHINIAIEMVNRQWKEGSEKNPEVFRGPKAEREKIHLLHLIASHHGTKEWGSPVTPKTPEAAALHYIDNMDAKLEMFKDIYAQAPNGSGFFDGGRLFGGTVVPSLSGSVTAGG